MELEIKIKISDGKVAVSVGGETHEYAIESAPDSAQVRVPVEVCDESHSTKEDGNTASLTVMTWNNQNWSIKRNHVKSITAEQSAEYAQKVRSMLKSVDGNIPNLLGMQEYGVVFDLAGNFATDTALVDYPKEGQFEWLKNGLKADYWAPGGFANNSSMVNGVKNVKLLYDQIWLWGSYASKENCKKAGYELPYYYGEYKPEYCKPSDYTTPAHEGAKIIEFELNGKKVAWANCHFFPKSQRKDYPYNADVVNWICMRNLLWVLKDYEYVIISGDLNWDNKRFMLTYDEAVAAGNTYQYPTAKEDGGDLNRYKYAGVGKDGFVTADYAINGYGMAGVKRGENGETDVDRLNTVDSVLVKGFKIKKVRKLLEADWFDKDHRPVWCELDMV